MRVMNQFVSCVIPVFLTLVVMDLCPSTAFAFDPFGIAVSAGREAANKAEQERRAAEIKAAQERADAEHAEYIRVNQCESRATDKKNTLGNFSTSGVVQSIRSYVDARKKFGAADIEADQTALANVTKDYDERSAINAEYNSCIDDLEAKFFAKHGDYTGSNARYKQVERKEKTDCWGKTCHYNIWYEDVETSEQKKYNDLYNKSAHKWAATCSKDRAVTQSEQMVELQNNIKQLTTRIKTNTELKDTIVRQSSYMDAFAKSYVKDLKDLWDMTEGCSGWRRYLPTAYEASMDNMTTCQIFHNVIQWDPYSGKGYLEVCPTADSIIEN